VTPDSASHDPVRTAVIGYGLAGSAFHAPLVAATDGLALTVIVTGNPVRAGAASRRYPGVRVVADPACLWAEPDSIDLVVVATPNGSHVPLALAAIEAGIPVVVDKPVAATVDAARTVADAAAEKGLLVSVFHNRRWDGDALTVRRLLAEGALGTVHRFESRFERWRPKVTDGTWREAANPDQAGGLLYDLGSHLIDQALLFFGPVRSVYAEVNRVRVGALVDDDVFVALTHHNGTRSHLWASATAAHFSPRFRVLGSAGSFVKDGMDVQEEALRVGNVPSDGDWGVEPENMAGQLGTPDNMAAVPTERGAYPAYYAGVRDALRGGGPAPVTIEQSIEVLAVIEAAQRSARRNITITL
jgi:predicted dehydrogenase